MCSELCAIISAPFANAATATGGVICTSTLPTAIATIVLGEHRLFHASLDPAIKLDNCGPCVLVLV